MRLESLDAHAAPLYGEASMRVLAYQGLDISRHGEAFDRVRSALEAGDLRSADVKKLQGARFFRAKLGYADRLLLQFLRRGDETVCVALEIIHGHAYDRSRFLRGTAVEESKLEELSSNAPPDALPVSYLHPTRANIHFLDKPISFDDAQDAILRLPCPLVLVGSAGSGKTALTLEKMRHFLGDVAYITRSAYLAESARALYFSHGYEPDAQNADFLSYRELLESVRVPEGRAVLFADFREWFGRNEQSVRFTDAHQCFEEFRGVITAEPAGTLTREAYVALGVRQSLFAPAERDAIYSLFEKYLAWLDRSGLFEPNGVAARYLGIVEPRYDFIVLDEVQDLTSVEIALALRMLKTPGQFLFTGDANQIVHPSFFSWSRLKSLIWHDATLAERQAVSVLDVNYRNAVAVTRTANALLRLKNARFGSIDKESTALIRPMAPDEGEVVGMAAQSAAVQELDDKTRRSAKFAVIVLRDEHKADARKRFRTPLVFSVHEAKGLEYENVILFNLISSERAAYQEVCEGVTDADLAATDLAYRRARDKSDKSLETFRFYVNALYVALTRAVRTVYLVESDTQHPLLQKLSISFSVPARAIPTQASSPEDWQREARRLEMQGKREQADAIRANVLGVAPVAWKVVDPAGYRELAARALAPGSVSAKAKQALFEYACFHEDRRLADRLASDARHSQAHDLEGHRRSVLRRALAPYEGRNFKDVLWQTERHGVEFRTPWNETPLAMAAMAGNVALVDALLERGARLTAMDHFGRMPVHWALLRAYDDPAFAGGPLGALYERLAPPSLDVQVDGRLFKIGREQGEYFFLLATIALYKRLFHSRLGRFRGLTTAVFLEGDLERFPESVLRGDRRKRTYMNQLLARNEPGSSYRPNRKLWIRERTGHYAPNPAVLLRTQSEDGRFQPILEVLGISLLDEHLTESPNARAQAGGAV